MNQRIWMSGAMVASIALTIAVQAAQAQDAMDGVRWQGKTIAGQAITLPDKEKFSLLVLAKVDQRRSTDALKYVAEKLGDAEDVSLIAVVSGPGADAAAKRLIQTTGWKHAVVADPDYRLSGEVDARVWPTTVMVNKAGRDVAHLGGITSAYSKQLDAYLAFARGQIDRAELERRLHSNDVVASTDHQIAGRHLEVAMRLIEQRQITQARDELLKAIEAQPDHAALHAALARVQTMLGDPSAALATLAKIDKIEMPGWQLACIRGRALILQGKWDEAREVLAGALRLNPDPAEAHYFLGRIYEHQGEAARASEHYRAAFEHTRAAKQLGVVPEARQANHP